MTTLHRLAFLLILCVAPFAALRGQTFKAVYKAVGDTVLQTGASVRALSDGYAAAGIEGGSDPFVGGSDRAFVTRTDLSGAVQFHSSFSLPVPGLPLQLERLADGGYALLCLSTSDGSTVVTRLASSGALLWQRRYGTGMDAGGGTQGIALARPAFSEASDGGLLVAGTRLDGGLPRPVLFKTDASGSVQWGADLAASGYGFGMAAVSGSPSQRWTAFYAPGAGPESPGSVTFCRVDESGSLLGSSSASLPSGTSIAGFFPRSLLAAPDGSLRFTAQTVQNESYGLAAARLSSSGEILSARSYGPPSGLVYYPTQAMEPFALSDGGVGIPVLAVDASGAGPYASGLLRLDADLNPTAWRVVAYSASVPEILFGMRQTADGGFAVCGGQIQPNGAGQLDGDALLWRVDASYSSGACALEAGTLPSASALSFSAASASPAASPISVFSAALSPDFASQTPAVSYACAPSGGGGCPAPSAAAFQPLGPVSVQAGWTAVPAANSYRHRSRAVGASTWGGWKTVSAPSAVLTGLTPSTQYQMEIVARCGTNNANNSAVLAASFSTPGPEACAVPSGLTAQAESATAVNLAWEAVSGSTGYRLRWRPAAGGAWTEIPAAPANTVKGTARKVGGLSAGTEYEFQARAQCGTTVLTDWSAPVFASTWFTSASDPLWTRNGAGQMTATLPQSVVGIGHANPQAALHVGDGTLHGGTVLFSGTSGPVPPTTAGPQMFWAPEKAAFRAGSVDGSQWANENVGPHSIALGKNATASGENSVAIGNGITAQEGEIVIGLLEDDPPGPGKIKIEIGGNGMAIGKPGDGVNLPRIVCDEYGGLPHPDIPNPTPANIPQLCGALVGEFKGTDVYITETGGGFWGNSPCGGNLRVKNHIYSFCMDVRSGISIGTDPEQVRLSASEPSKLFVHKAGTGGEATRVAVFDADNGRVGIGKIGAPQGLLHVSPFSNASNDASFIVTQDEKVGIGVTAPVGHFQVSDGHFVVSEQGKVGIGTTAPNGLFDVQWDGQSLFVVNENGNIGIGVANPQNKFEVCGVMKAKEAIIRIEGWCDYVFDESYCLLPLTEVEEFVKANKRLPEVPSETEIVESGLPLGEMVKLQMKKIEELTLYVIELEKRLTSLQNTVPAAPNK